MSIVRVIYGKVGNVLDKCGDFNFTARVGDKIFIEGKDLFHTWVDDNSTTYYLFGSLVGVRQADGTLASPSTIKSDPSFIVGCNQISLLEGRFVFIKVDKDYKLEVWADQYGRLDIYCLEFNGAYILATGLNLLPMEINNSEMNDAGLIQSLVIYGSRPAKRDNLYRNVMRLGINQGYSFDNNGLEFLMRSFYPVSTTPSYKFQDLNRYSEYFIEAIKSRSSTDGNIVYLSSGWDSTAILATLVHLHGNRKVRAIIGRMRYSDRSGVINQYEIDRAKAFADYYSVELKVVEFDYRSGVEEVIDEIRPLLQSQQFASLVALNHWKLAAEAAKTANGNEAIFAGEISDGAHNLGFSQYTTIFHPVSRDFREYSDKMASYLFGPTFYKQVIEGAHEKDPVWILFKANNTSIIMDDALNTKTAITKQLLASFFLRGGRIPFYSIKNSSLLTKDGCNYFTKNSESKYLDHIVDSITPENLYAYYLHLYHSFHWQGSTVASLEHTATYHGLQCHMPFYDSQIIEFLSGMPEDWGRGLDLNNTKYPLKWMLKNKIDYPYELQSGPHAYTYDVKPGFSLAGEILLGSAFAPIFKQKLRDGSFIDILNSQYFDLNYINNSVKKYIGGEELGQQEKVDVMSLATHSLVGVY